MRPATLEMSGFSAFREPTTISFEGTDLLALIGPTGSGKSSIIDAITFALYGSVSRYDDDRLVEPAIHKLCNDARIRLDFELNGQRYTAVRVVRRTENGATTREARLVRVGSDGSEEILAGRAREMTAAVPALLGLSFDQFTRTVVLPQGDFAAFLHGDKTERQQLLRQLLDAGIYEHMGQIARARSKENQSSVRLLAEQREKRGALGDDELAVLKAHQKAVVAAQKAVAKHADKLMTVEKQLVTSRADVERAEKQLGSLRRLAVPVAVTNLGPKLAEAGEVATAAEAQLTAARVARDEATKAMEKGPDIVVLHRTIDALERLQRLEADIAAAAPKAEDLAREAGEALAAAVEAEQALGLARQALDEAQAVAGLGATIAALVVGEPCPVCSQTVTALPAHDVDAELARAKKAHTAAQKVHVAAAKEADAHARANTELATRLATMRSEQAAAATVVPAKADLKTLRSQVEASETAKKAQQAAAAEADKAEKHLDKARGALTSLREQEQGLRGDLTSARDTVTERKPPAPKGTSLREDWNTLVAWGAGEAEAVAAELSKVVDATEKSEAALRSLRTEIEAACDAVGVRAIVAKAGEQLATEVSSVAHQVSDAIERREEVAQLAQTIAELEGSIVVDTEMGRLLNASGFERWLLQAALDDLVSRATERLFELSGGQYSLESSDGDFWIRDHRNADELRGVRTLSGGETFLASLALALALSESIAELAVEGGPRIESMFLDEGFGTLDPDALDLVATALEELSASGRLIGIVTHIRELADRMPVRFEVSKDATTARVERVEA